ncbi:MAG: GIY-YIG nuclease family protein [Pseudomonadales bacterium]|nr:GIY-YIG nuclease family protein [Pseudomonadales bacterium]
MSENNYTIVYLLTNPSMPNLVKIGKTNRESVDARLGELYTTGVPVPFDCAYACKVDFNLDVEARLHKAFEPSRINPQREFFEIDVDQARVILEILAVEDVTPEVRRELNGQADIVEINSGRRLARKRRPPLNFVEMGIPEGSILTWANEGDYEVSVGGPRKVFYKGIETSLTAVTRDILGLEHNVQPTQFWQFENRNLQDFYNDTYSGS